MRPQKKFLILIWAPNRKRFRTPYLVKYIKIKKIYFKNKFKLLLKS